MKILILHNKYQRHGGEDVVVQAECDLLRRAGHDVRVELVLNATINNPRTKARALIKAPFDGARKQWFARLVADWTPDVVHIHNFFPLLTPAIHEAATQMGFPVVQTLHNYRLLCAGALFLRNERVCEKCLEGNRLWGIVHRCYRNSLPGSLAAVAMQNRAHRTNAWQNNVHRFIALSEFARRKFIKGGLPSARVAVKPNFTVQQPPIKTKRSGALFVGRLSPEKGLETLLRAWVQLPNVPLNIIGDGPELERLKENAPQNVLFLGHQSAEVVKKQMGQAQVLIQPSLWYEGFPMTIVEAFSQSLPVMASKIGSLAELVTPNRNGMHFRPGDADDLAQSVLRLLANAKGLEQLSSGARKSYEQLYTPEINLMQLEQIYDEAIEEVAR